MIDVALPEAPRNTDADKLARWLRGQSDRKYCPKPSHSDEFYMRGYKTQDALEILSEHVSQFRRWENER